MSGAAPSIPNQFICRQREELLSKTHRRPGVRQLALPQQQARLRQRPPSTSNPSSWGCTVEEAARQPRLDDCFPQDLPEGNDWTTLCSREEQESNFTLCLCDAFWAQHSMQNMQTFGSTPTFNTATSKPSPRG
ncbi:uncharacterized protein FAM241A isoform X3 [Takifugu flavidus]|uniref:uncharacterized protein FAM241A isoform X3 n=1 Tax=Takifugu flavidus TaxID=433684 RepID=UPI002544208A|nr:uncharacterized protein FAM241A isoform X3 [Takifugu flavidus]